MSECTFRLHPEWRGAAGRFVYAEALRLIRSASARRHFMTVRIEVPVMLLADVNTHLNALGFTDSELARVFFIVTDGGVIP